MQNIVSFERKILGLINKVYVKWFYKDGAAFIFSYLVHTLFIS